MKRKLAKLVLLLLLFLRLPTIAQAQGGGGYDLSWFSLDGGGGYSSASGYTLGGAIGQPDAGTLCSGGGYTLVGGFWGGTAIQYRIYLPVVLRS